jgi:membrane associated rhomboid family serine protease
MGGLIPLGDASRRPASIPIVTGVIILINILVFLLELMRGDAFVMQWSVVPAQITSGHHLITILTAMFMHGSWSHIIGNMVFLWAFAPEIEDAMDPVRYLVFYLLGGLVAMLAQVVADPHSTVPNLGASGAIAAVMGAFIVILSPGPDSCGFVHLYIWADHIHSGGLVDWRVISQPAHPRRRCGAHTDWRSGVPGARWRLYLWSYHRAFF